MIESGTDWLGAEYKRTDHDFTFRHLQQDMVEHTVKGEQP